MLAAALMRIVRGRSDRICPTARPSPDSVEWMPLYSRSWRASCFFGFASEQSLPTARYCGLSPTVVVQSWPRAISAQTFAPPVMVKPA